MTDATKLHTPEEVLFDVVNHVGIITLNRPKALNALSGGMIHDLDTHLDRCERDPAIRAVVFRGNGPRAFCAGGDVVAVARSHREHTALYRAFFKHEYALDLRIHRCAKPTATLMHGVVMGGGMGIAQGTRLRLVTGSTRMAMPETRIGLVPDVGASHFLTRMPMPLALYIALTGAMLNGADAIFSGLADAWSAIEDPAQLEAALQAIEWRGAYAPALRRALVRTEQPTAVGGAELPALAAAVFRHFDPGLPVAGIVASLKDEPDPALRPWCDETLEVLGARSPLMLNAARRALLQGRHLSLEACFEMEYDLVQGALRSGELLEGVRAHLIDKDQAPLWKRRTLAEVTEADVDELFTHHE